MHNMAAASEVGSSEKVLRLRIDELLAERERHQLSLDYLDNWIKKLREELREQEIMEEPADE